MPKKIIEGFQLSPQQRRLWKVQQTCLRRPALAIGLLSIEGTLEKDRLKTAFERIIRRYEIFRTTFHRLPEMATPLQVITEKGNSLDHEIDLSSLAPSLQAEKVEELVAIARDYRADIEHGPVLEGQLIILSESKHLLLVKNPALCADAGTIRNLALEISRGCVGQVEESEGVYQFADLAEWQNELLKSDSARLGRKYWAGRNLSLFDSLRLPFAAQPPKQTAFSPAVLATQAAPTVLKSVEALSESYQTNIGVLLMAGWQALLWRMIRQPEMTVGMLFDGRTYEELESAFGVFSRYLPIQTEIGELTTFSELIEQVRETIQDAERWQDCFSWDEGTEQDQNNERTYPFCFAFEKKMERFILSHLNFRLEKLEVISEPYTIHLHCVLEEKSLRLEFSYNSNEVSSVEIQRLAREFHTLLEFMVRNPAVAVSEGGLLSDAEKQEILHGFNVSHQRYELPQCFSRLFENAANKTPHNTAVKCDEVEISYENLNRQANKLASYLRKNGVGPDAVVALCLERSEQSLVGILGIMKSCGAYLPLDSDAPIERLKLILEEAKPVAIITQQKLLQSLPECNGKLIGLDFDGPEIALEPDENPTAAPALENLAYLIFTSGSTGVPKGVGIEQRQLLNYIFGISSILGLSEGCHYATVSTFAADLGHTAIFPALASGGCLHIISQECSSNADAFSAYFKSHPIDCLKIVPSHLDALQSVVPLARLLPRQCLVIGGEAASTGLIEKLTQAGKQIRILNHYGPTETTVGAATHLFQSGVQNKCTLTKASDSCRSDETKTGRLPIGSPIPNARVYILDRNLQPTPVWVMGEIYIGGDGVGRGYLGKPQLTAEKFLPDPYSPKAGMRMYRTGDLGRYQPTGAIEFLGRRDNQVKIRGYRIELGEIEQCLRRHPAVDSALVIAGAEGEADHRLLAYVIGKGGQEPEMADLRRHLQASLPNYMQPAAIIRMQSFPLTANGKIDRERLPAPEREVNRESDKARTVVEEVLTGIWQEVLGLEQVGVGEQFFELGGHSLLATQVISRVREAFGIELPIRALFEAPTIEGLAERVESVRGEGSELAPPIRPVLRHGAMPLSYAQQRLWFLDQLAPGNPAYNVTMAVRLRGRLNVKALKATFSEIVRRHEALRTVFVGGESEPVQKILAAETVLIEEDDLSRLAEAEREESLRERVRDEAQRPFDLCRGPLMRIRLLYLGEGDQVVTVSLHHIVSDGWSVGVLVKEIGSLYGAYSEGRESPLSELEVQYADYAVWQREWLSGAVLDRQLSYWRAHLSGAAGVLELPTDRGRGVVASYDGASQSVVIEEELTSKLRELSRREGGTLFMTLLAAYQTLLYRYSGQSDVVIGVPIANRNRKEIEPLIGFFVNTLALRGRPEGSKRFVDLLREAREATLGAYAHQDLPFEKLVEELQIERSLSHHPLFQTMFDLKNIADRQLEIKGLDLEPVIVGHQIVKFDLSLTFLDAGSCLAGSMEYRTSLFDQATIAWMKDSFITLLEKIVLDPTQRLSEIQLIKEDRTCGLTVNDFPEANLSQRDFEALLFELDRV